MCAEVIPRVQKSRTELGLAWGREAEHCYQSRLAEGGWRDIYLTQVLPRALGRPGGIKAEHWWRSLAAAAGQHTEASLNPYFHAPLSAKTRL